MDDGNDRLMRCFTSAFPRATSDEIVNSKLEMIPGWDSLRGVTLLAVLDEEFSVQIDLSELLELGSFDAVKRHLMAQGLMS